MTGRNDELRALAGEYCEKLSQHEVLQKVWQHISLILKGSVARGRADQYSDIDFVFYCDEGLFSEIVGEYHSRGLTSRTDGVFVPLPDWIGHYHFETYQKLQGYFTGKDMPQVWECTHVVALHDPEHLYAEIVDAGMGTLFADSLALVKGKYLEMQLTLDWLTRPLQRDDKVAVLLRCATFVRLACQLCYLLDRQPYPHDKWVFQYLEDTRLGKQLQTLLLDYSKIVVNDTDMQHLELQYYPQFARGTEIVQIVSHFIESEFGQQPWINEWYLYV